MNLSSRRAREPAAEGRQARTKATEPISTANAANASQRKIAYSTFTVVPACPAADGARLGDGCPTEKVNAPEIGCESAETTRHDTV